MNIPNWLLPLVRFWKFLISWVRFVVYFAIIIMGIGGLGVWITFGQYKLNVPGVLVPNVLSNLATFIIAIAVNSFADYLITKGEGDERTKALILFSFTILSTAAAVCILVVSTQQIKEACAWLGGVLAALTWLSVKVTDADLGGQKFVSILGGRIQ